MGRSLIPKLDRDRDEDPALRVKVCLKPRQALGRRTGTGSHRAMSRLVELRLNRGKEEF
jgi:hypothetical protein